MMDIQEVKEGEGGRAVASVQASATVRLGDSVYAQGRTGKSEVQLSASC
jgi:hypothetical protein